LSHTSNPVCSGYFGDLMNCLPGWPQTSILLMSASQVARITGIGTGAWLVLFLF
jgi:hypothetical protein